jgi:hypothetical protein
MIWQNKKKDSNFKGSKIKDWAKLFKSKKLPLLTCRARLKLYKNLSRKNYWAKMLQTKN